MQNVLNAFDMKWVISIEMKMRLSAITLERLTEEEKQTLIIAVATVLCRSNIWSNAINVNQPTIYPANQPTIQSASVEH